MRKAYIHLRTLEDLKNQLIEEAKQKGLSLNAYILMIIMNREK